MGKLSLIAKGIFTVWFLAGLSACATENPPVDSGLDAAEALAPDLVVDQLWDAGDGRADPCEGLVEDPTPGVTLTDTGYVQGELEGNSYVYKGIPYAASPTGDLRWRPPLERACWAGIKKTSTYGERCMQKDNAGNAVGSEDCLALNIWSPKRLPEGGDKSPLPVMFFIHGGSHVVGSASDRYFGIDIYDGRALAELGPAVVVSINYRLGALGYLVHSALAAENGEQVSGNYGLLDQIAALKWVKRNIAAFGGDPQRVMVFGQSAGAIATCTLLSSPLAKGLFSRAMMISGNCSVMTSEAAEAGGKTFVEDLKCAEMQDVAACLREKTAAQITTAPMKFYGATEDSGFNGTSIDGWVIPKAPQAALASGEHHAMPMIMSTTDNEYTTLLGYYGTTAVDSEESYKNMVALQFGDDTVTLLTSWYPAADYPTYNDAWLALLGDYGYVCPTRRALTSGSANQAQSVWRAHFTHGFTHGPLAIYGAGHGMDVYFTFGHLSYSGALPTEAELSLSREMMGYWTRFAATGDPNDPLGDALPWAAYNANDDNYLQLDTPITSAHGVHTAKCDLWDSY